MHDAMVRPHVTARGNAREPIFLDLQKSREYPGAHPQCGYTLSEIAAHPDIQYTTVSKVVNENGEN